MKKLLFLLIFLISSLSMIRGQIKDSVRLISIPIAKVGIENVLGSKSSNTVGRVPEFKLLSSGRFVTKEDRNAYGIYRVDGKTAHELYEIVRMNISRIYKSPKDVMSVIEDKSISIRAYSNDLILFGKLFGVSYNLCGCYYNLLFEFKDGKIKVCAPVIEDVYKMNTRIPFTDIMRVYFDKNGNVKKKKYWDVQHIECGFTALLYDILRVNSSNDNW